ncbi:hypothetical protein CLOP_g1942 [Closterium sp. NIES-67]|nr:hypothetical protein CLOP_g1942 [Closterium sp. NIES-67]
MNDSSSTGECVANGTWGTAFTAAPLPLFSYFNTKATCGYQFAFNASFAFSLDPDSEAGGDGLVFVVAAALPDRLGGVGRRSVGVEFDSVLSVKHSDPNDNHVGVNVGGSPVSLASATAPLILNDAQTKHAWIHYDPTSGGTLRVFLSSDPVQPLTPTLRARVSLCSILLPKASNLALGFVLDEDSFSSQGFNSAFHYASDCWAYAVVAAVEAAYSIASNWSQPPVLSVDHLRLALSSNCDGGSPTKALQFLLNATNQGRGTKYYGIRGIERTAFYGWFGLMLAVQRQPVIVHIEASAPSFQDYDGRGKYADEACFSGHLNHVVLVVGFLSANFDPSNSAMPPPFWIIRNSWGTQWGDQGHMRMDIRSGDGICGINTLPGLFPVVRMDVCGSSSRNPCVVGTCVNDGRGSYSCGDTCAGVGRQVELCGEAASDAACEAAFQALNPARHQLLSWHLFKDQHLHHLARG